jgi:mRNA interferase MazF
VNRSEPSRGEIWLVDFDPTIGHEQAGLRPALVVSVDLLNHGPAGLAIVIPVTSRSKKIPIHVAIDPPEGGLTLTSYIKCEDIRSVSRERFGRKCGAISVQTMSLVQDKLSIILAL